MVKYRLEDDIAGSANGRPTESGSVYLGSNPSPATFNVSPPRIEVSPTHPPGEEEILGSLINSIFYSLGNTEISNNPINENKYKEVA